MSNNSKNSDALKTQIEYLLDELYNAYVDGNDDISNWSLKDFQTYLRKGIMNFHISKDYTEKLSNTNRFSGTDKINEVINDLLLKYLPDFNAKKALNELKNNKNTTLKGFKTATYGKKSHRDNITQLENSVRKMF